MSLDYNKINYAALRIGDKTYGTFLVRELLGARFEAQKELCSCNIGFSLRKKSLTLTDVQALTKYEMLLENLIRCIDDFKEFAEVNEDKIIYFQPTNESEEQTKGEL